MKKTTLIVCILVIPALAGADLVVTERMSASGFMGFGGSEGTEVTYLKGDMIRSESEMAYKGMMPGMAPGMKAQEPARSVAIIRLDKGLIWHLDEENKTYTEMALDTGMTGGVEAEVQFEVKETKVTKTGKKREIAGYTCAGVNVEMVFEVGAEEERMTETANILFWLAPEKKELEEMGAVWERMVESMGSGKQSFGMKDAMDDLNEIIDDLDGVPLAMDMTMNLPMGQRSGEDEAEMKEAMKMMREMMKGEGEEETAEEDAAADPPTITIKREAISISKEKVDASLFEIPDGYKKAGSAYQEEEAE